MAIVTADIVIVGPPPNRERIAVVEVSNRIDLLADHGNDRLGYMRVTGGESRYFMLVSQDVAYVWTDHQPGARPSARFSMTPVIRRFMPNLAGGERLYGFQVESIVTHWLFELVSGWRGSGDEPENALASIGFLEAIHGGNVYSEAAV